MRFRLRDDLFACEVDGQTVLLDLREDRYFMASRSLHAALEGVGEDNDQSVEQRGLSSLVERGLLVVDDQLTEPQAVTPEELEDVPELMPSGTLVAVAIAAQIHAAITLKFAPLLQAVNDLRRIKGVKPPQRAAQADAFVRAAAFRKSSKYFTADKKCLRRSIALARHLALNGHEATLHFGVRVRPFGAHAWVQQGQFVLNDTVDEVRRFKTIVAI